MSINVTSESGLRWHICITHRLCVCVCGCVVCECDRELIDSNGPRILLFLSIPDNTEEDTENTWKVEPFQVNSITIY
jgi:hypothetical protein